MKKLLCLLLVLLMTASILLVACKDNDNDGENPDDNLLFPAVSSSETTTEPETTEPASYEFTDVDEMVYVKHCLKVNIRSTPSWASNDNLVGSLEFGDERTYKRVKYNSVWSGIEIDGDICYVRSEFLTTDDGIVVFEEADKTVYANNTVSDSGVFVYSFTHEFKDTTVTESAKWGVVKHGAELHVTGVSKNGKWYRIDFTYTDKDGKTVEATDLYIYKGTYVSDTKPADKPADAQ
ncbi:MAG: hypothetical protein IKV16_03950 [Clostridia bacterium]|nr:hypothetical protein [Clostridia bacterium]